MNFAVTKIEDLELFAGGPLMKYLMNTLAILFSMASLSATAKAEANNYYFSLSLVCNSANQSGCGGKVLRALTKIGCAPNGRSIYCAGDSHSMTCSVSVARCQMTSSASVYFASGCYHGMTKVDIAEYDADLSSNIINESSFNKSNQWGFQTEICRR